MVTVLVGLVYIVVVLDDAHLLLLTAGVSEHFDVFDLFFR